MDLFRKKAINLSADTEYHFAKCLTALDLTFLGIGAIIGAGIFVLTGIVAATQTGPAIIYSYIIAGLACAFAALSYAELAAMIGGCGSAYGYAYAGFGELFAWIVGWDLLLEYSIAVSAVSVGWSGYAKDILKALHIYLPQNFLTSPLNGGIMNIPALFIISTLTILLSFGIKSSARFNNVMVLVKLIVISLFIVVASTEFNPQYWTPFNPFGWQGVVEGASLIFFAYVGFDAVSTAAEEAKRPQTDLPIGIIASLVVCTVIYMIVAGLLTGIVPYTELNVSSPISHAMILLGHRFVAATIAVGAIAGLTTVMLVLFYGLSRVFFAMARDGLLPVYFAKTHPESKVPLRIIILCGLLMGTTAALIPIDDLAELVNIGTLFAFIIVCSGVIYLRYTHPDIPRPFKTPFMPYIPSFGIICCLYLIYNLPFVTLIRFIAWMVAGMLIYFFYGKNNSHLSVKTTPQAEA
jgi:APA family basic amino acid/polyamine antiporter